MSPWDRSAGVSATATVHGAPETTTPRRSNPSREPAGKVVATVAWAAGNGDRSENGDYIYGKRRLREIDARLTFLAKRLRIAEPVDPAQQKNGDRVVERRCERVYR